ncbi:MAG: TRAP transporter small permease [Betaproteobacteria bacterium]|nr:MAG: TRAP transporter small permease [Betaproteobacteria bacterium]
MKLLKRLNLIALVMASLSILVMTLIGGIDVLSTAALGKPIATVYELTQTLMVLVVFLALGHLQLTDGNIAIDVLPNKLRPRGKRFHAALVQFVALVSFAALTWQAWLMALDSWSIKEYSMGLVAFPLYPAKFAVVIGSALTVLCCAAKLFEILAGLPPASDASQQAARGFE